MAAHFRPCKRCRPTGGLWPEEDWVNVVAGYIDLHYTEPLTLEHLAKIAHGSPYHVQRTFKRTVGMTPIEYIRSKRLEAAKARLLGSQRSIAEIGASAGFANHSYFTACFKKYTGCTPEQYRRNGCLNDSNARSSDTNDSNARNSHPNQIKGEQWDEQDSGEAGVLDALERG